MKFIERWKFYLATFNTAISFNSVTDSPYVLYDAWHDCSFSLATLVYIDKWQRPTKYLRQVAGATRVCSDVGVWLMLRRRYADLALRLT